MLEINPSKVFCVEFKQYLTAFLKIGVENIVK